MYSASYKSFATVLLPDFLHTMVINHNKWPQRRKGRIQSHILVWSKWIEFKIFILSVILLVHVMLMNRDE